MKASKAVITELNKCLALELIAINQFFLHARMQKNWGLADLGKTEYKFSIEVMKEADKLIERVLFLEALPNLQSLGKLNIGQNVPEMLAADLKLTIMLNEQIQSAILAFETEGDFVSRELLQGLNEENQERLDFFETQIELMNKMGTDNYLQSAKGSS